MFFILSQNHLLLGHYGYTNILSHFLEITARCGVNLKNYSGVKRLKLYIYNSTTPITCLVVRLHEKRVEPHTKNLNKLSGVMKWHFLTEFLHVLSVATPGDYGMFADDQLLFSEADEASTSLASSDHCGSVMKIETMLVVIQLFFFRIPDAVKYYVCIWVYKLLLIQATALHLLK